MMIYFDMKIQPGMVLSNIQASRPAMKTGLAMNMDIVLSTPSFPVIVEKNTVNPLYNNTVCSKLSLT